MDTIVWLIEGNDREEAVSMVVSLSEFFRLVLSKGKEFITIREEEMHIRSYLEIQHARYRDILEYDISIDPGIGSGVPETDATASCGKCAVSWY